MPFARCAATEAWADGARTLWGDDGARLFVHPDEWATAPPRSQPSTPGLDPAVVVATDRPAGSSYLDHLDAVAANQSRRQPPVGPGT